MIKLVTIAAKVSDFEKSINIHSMFEKLRISLLSYKYQPCGPLSSYEYQPVELPKSHQFQTPYKKGSAIILSFSNFATI